MLFESVEKADDKINPRVIGLKVLNRILVFGWLVYVFRYLEIKLILNIEKEMTPSVANKAPVNPANLKPTKVAELIAIGPGELWESDNKSKNSS